MKFYGAWGELTLHTVVWRKGAGVHVPSGKHTTKRVRNGIGEYNVLKYNKDRLNLW